VSPTTGTKLGPYEIVAPIGAGGMGEVFRAHDSRLGRDVALKVLPDTFNSDAERLARFEQEARAIATLSHPNIVAVFDVGEHSGSHYIVTELLEGETLRVKLAGGALPVRKAQEFALQITQGLAAAHDKGIVHRDLKPENIVITKDGRAKILDFGLAKQSMAAMASGATMTGMPQTTPGVTLGTVGYMSPEQVRGIAADHRSDIFSFGAVLHEMLSGERPFHRESSAEVMTAILKDDPPELGSSTSRPIPPGIERIMRRCLEKDPEQRFQSARDLAFALEAMSGVSTTTSQASIVGKSKRISVSRTTAMVAAASTLALIVTAVYFYASAAPASSPAFRRLTTSRGMVRMARFSPDGQTVVFGAMWNGEPMRLFQQRVDGGVFNPLATQDADLLSVSPTGELGVALNRRFVEAHTVVGTLARTSFTGGEPREVLEGVTDADWAAKGSEFAISRQVGNHYRLEYPIGTVLYETTGYVSHLRFSHQGDKIAFMDHPIAGDDRGFISVIDVKSKQRTVLTREYSSEDGLAWTPDDREIWFGAIQGDVGDPYSMCAVSLAGKERTVLRTPINNRVQDIAKDGSVLMIAESFRIDSIFGDESGKTRDLTWTDMSWGQTLSNDAKWLAFSTEDAGATTNYSTFLRKTDGSQAVKLGEGTSTGISPDNKWVAANLVSDDHSMLFLPLGTGESRKIHSDNIHFEVAKTLFLPDSQRVLLTGHEDGKGSRTYLFSMSGGEGKPVTAEETVGDVLSPDGKQLLAHDRSHKFFVYPLDGGASRPVAQLQENDTPLAWLDDGHTVIFREGTEQTVNTFQLDMNSGAKKPWKNFAPRDKVGLEGIYNVGVTSDGKHYIVVEAHTFSSVFVVKGLK
jgi:serine/threonine protein kinase/Tol biopolymer transport system component